MKVLQPVTVFPQLEIETYDPVIIQNTWKFSLDEYYLCIHVQKLSPPTTP